MCRRDQLRARATLHVICGCSARSGYSICCMLCMDGFLVIRAEFVETPKFVRSHPKGESPSSG